MRQIPVKLIAIILAILAIVVIIPFMFGVNDAGKRTVVQWPNGKLFVKFTPGVYLEFFGTHEEYNDVITFDFDKEKAEGSEATIDQQGIAVRYQDGGTGTVFGKARFSLPVDEPTMLKLHKEFRSNVGVAQKLIKSVTEEGENLTAGLMTSEDAYATKRGIFTQWSQEQIARGKFQTELKTVTETDEVTGKKLEKVIPQIKYGDDGRPLQFESDLKAYGIAVSGYQVTDWGFEPKTLTQIATKREATMAIITAKANAERAKQDTITAEEQGKADVMKAQYEKEVEKKRAVVVAEQEKEVAEIAAAQKVAVAAQELLEAKQKRLAAAEYKQEQILRGEGDAAYKKLVIEADGALAQKLATYETVMARFAEEFGKQKWVPEVMMGDSGKGGNAAADFIGLLTIKAANDLGLDMSVKK
jgi:hypothetical protein